VISLGALLLRAILVVAGATSRVEIAAGGEHLEAARRSGRPVIFSFWHNRSFLAADFFDKRIFRRGFDVVVLASRSRDVELVARLAVRLGLRVVRGSASRGGREAVRAIYRAVTRHGSSPVMIPDGPRGPLYEFKVGTAILAQLTQAPILPMGLAARRFFTIKSWDRLIVPWPLSRVAVVVGAPQEVARGISAAELEEERRRLQALLVELTREAEARLGA
jgi:lysophospholipid acyltransferase (LPLAT)-like uncharacterized protein